MNWIRPNPACVESEDGKWRVYRRFPLGYVRYHLYHKGSDGWKVFCKGGKSEKEMQNKVLHITEERA